MGAARKCSGWDKPFTAQKIMIFDKLGLILIVGSLRDFWDETNKMLPLC